MNRASPYGCTTAMLEVARERGVEDQRVFKIILGVRKLIKTFSRKFILAADGLRDARIVRLLGGQVLTLPSFPSPRGKC